MSYRTFMLLLGALAAPALSAASALAQQPAAASGVSTAPAATQVSTGRNIFSLNPMGAVFRVYSGEYERGLGGHVSVALAGTLWRSAQDYEDPSGSADAQVTYASMDAKLRYYPTVALRGFSVGALVGATRLGGSVTACAQGFACDDADGAVNALSTGVEVDHSWLLGAEQRFYVALGAGAKRLYPLNGEDVDATLAYPFARFAIGVRF